MSVNLKNIVERWVKAASGDGSASKIARRSLKYLQLSPFDAIIQCLLRDRCPLVRSVCRALHLLILGLGQRPYRIL